MERCGMKQTDRSVCSSFLAAHGNVMIIESYLKLMAEDKLRRDAQLQELAKSQTKLQREENQQHRHIKQLQQDLDNQAGWRTQAEADLACQDRLLNAYRAAAQDVDDKLALVNALFQQAFESDDTIEALDIFLEIANQYHEDESVPVRQLRALSRFNIGVVLATKVGDKRAAKYAYQGVLDKHAADKRPIPNYLP
jgi:hypothetical protein